VKDSKECERFRVGKKQSCQVWNCETSAGGMDSNQVDTRLITRRQAMRGTNSCIAYEGSDIQLKAT